ncbi:putative nucleic acid-binding Zn ribbon protein [Prauserella shujinwangii]|uniref:UPF0232 protein B0I33_105307 n=1 Tax=Prauserella shujinwangii TaxID=1453103 RepID=A0A2T0LV98_9PSEU|nr:putative nucleic acid-binding Zn ribbon protein [Prauserella shujinwangii]
MSALSPRVTDRPNVSVNSPQVGGITSKSPERDTERSTADGPNEQGGTDGDHTDAGRDPQSPQSGQPAQGRDLARAALQAARERANARGTEPGVVRRKRGGLGIPGQNPRRRQWSGPGFDERDPQPLGRLASRLAGQLGWAERLATGQVFGQWARLVGDEVAEHAQPVTLKDGELTVRASSTAWATQLRLLQRQLLAKIAKGVGHGVVTRMRIQGPTAPSWRKGPRHVSGRGPRDTYG